MTPRLRVFGVDYQFLSCGDVFTRGLAAAASELGLDYRHADCLASDLDKQILRHHPDLVFVVHGRKFARRYGNAFRDLHTAIWLLELLAMSPIASIRIFWVLPIGFRVRK